MPIHKRDPRFEKDLTVLGLKINNQARERLEQDAESGGATERLLNATDAERAAAGEAGAAPGIERRPATGTDRADADGASGEAGAAPGIERRPATGSPVDDDQD